MEKPHRKEKKHPHAVHVPVMLDAVTEYLQPSPESIFVDGTIGLGGHAEAIIKSLGPRGRFIGVDRDQQALAMAQQRLSGASVDCSFVADNFVNLDDILKSLGIDQVDRILLDLGLSSFQMDNPTRGFSLRSDGPLDMRMDSRCHLTAYDIVNSLLERELDQIIKDFGQERWHYQIARRIVQERSHKPIESTKELRHIVMKAIPYRRKWQRIHPATRTFQALRIVVNRELDSLERALDKYIRLLNKGGRLGVIAFHSLEDKIVKEKFRSLAKEGILALPFKKPLQPKFEEIKQNPRARSARFRVAERTL